VPGYYPKCDNRRCPICYPNWKEDEAAAKKKAEDDQKDCVECWRHFQKQAEAIVAASDPIAINRRVNAAYANLWLDDRRFQWAGLAAFASKQVSCGLLNAAELIDKSRRDSVADLRSMVRLGSAGLMSPYPARAAMDAATGEWAGQGVSDAGEGEYVPGPGCLASAYVL
jgi:hypothetical protein